MGNRIHIIFMVLNGIFVLINGFFVAFGTTPGVNLFAGLFCLVGFTISYYNYLNEVNDNDRRSH
jgi:hypothetical protein